MDTYLLSFIMYYVYSDQQPNNIIFIHSVLEVQGGLVVKGRKRFTLKNTLNMEK